MEELWEEIQELANLVLQVPSESRRSGESSFRSVGSILWSTCSVLSILSWKVGDKINNSYFWSMAETVLIFKLKKVFILKIGSVNWQHQSNVLIT